MLKLDETEHFLDRRVDFGLRLARNPQTECHVLGNGHVWKQRIGLKDHADIALVWLEIDNIFAIDFNCALIGTFKARNHTQNRGLATARWAEEGNEFALFDSEVEIVDDGSGAEALFQVLEIKKSHECYPAVVLNLLRRETSCNMMMLSHVIPKEIIASAEGS